MRIHLANSGRTNSTDSISIGQQTVINIARHRETKGAIHMRNIIFITIAILLHTGNCFAQGSAEARKYVQKVFNDSYTIVSNNASMKTNLSINNCNMSYKYTVAGNPEKQSVNMKYLDLKNINAGGGSITIWTVNEERRVTVSTLPKKFWAIDLSYNSNKYTDQKKIIESLKTIISSCK